MSTARVFTLLGTGSSGGVPRVGGAWGECDPAEPRNRRRRCALLVEQRDADGETAPGAATSGVTGTDAAAPGKTTVLIDAGADLREQLLASEVTSLEGVLLTHAHADHIFGLDDLRQLALQLRRPIDVHMDAPTAEVVMRAFGYCFRQAPGSSYPPFLLERRIERDEPVVVEGPGGEIVARPLVAEHGDIDALGFRVGDLAYLPDVKRVSDLASLAALEDVEVLIVDALRHRPHPAHMSLEEALAFVERVAPGRAVLTNMHSDLDYATLRRDLPEGVEPGYDGMRIALAVGDGAGAPRR